jgi:tRNA modification GTPase
MTTHDTIYALSSGRLPAAIAVVRISGPRAGDALRGLIGRLPEPRKAALARVRDGAGEIIDEALALWFPGPRSETGEDTAELQLHGGRAVVAAVFAALAKIDGLRPAEAGEFTRRAFENGQLDLTRVEGLADLIAADTEAQRRQAFRQLRGLLGDRAEVWRERLIKALALVEAEIDFPDEGDVPADLLAPALNEARALADEVGAVLDDGRRGERLRDGVVVAIAGWPNAGKSSLLNALVKRDAAIVSPYAGTTRDVIEVHLDLGGYPVTLLDTAGIRDSDDPVEQEGVRRARQRAQAADLVLWVLDVERERDGDVIDAAALKREFPATEVWIVRNKVDAVQSFRDEWKNSERLNFEFRAYPVSAKTGVGVSMLVEKLVGYASRVVGSAETSLVTRERQRHALADAVAALQRATDGALGSRTELVAEELRLAARALGRLVGRVDVEDILDVIFRDFCIGK